MPDELFSFFSLSEALRSSLTFTSFLFGVVRVPEAVFVACLLAIWAPFAFGFTVGYCFFSSIYYCCLTSSEGLLIL